MKKARRNMLLIFAFAVVAAVGLLAYIRLAPSDPAVWHVSPVAATEARQGDCPAAIKTVSGGARASCQLSGTPAEVLSRLDTIALSGPRTIRLAGSPQSGRITWITRSAMLGFPDYTTAEASPVLGGTRLDIFARQRFGSQDWGVNAARVRKWLDGL